MTDAIASSKIRKWERLEGDRGVFKAHWQDTANYMLPDRNDYMVERPPGAKRMTYIYDSTPVMALEQFAAGMHSLLTSTSLQWFFMRTEENRLDQMDAVRIWLEIVSDVMYRIFNGPKHNFASQSHELYLDEGSIGTACMAVLESPRSGILFSTRHMKECVIGENDEDRIDVNYRKWRWTAQQAVEKWGVEALKRGGCDKVLKAWAEGGDGGDGGKKFMFLHAVEPRLKRNPSRRDRRHKPFESVFVCVDDKATIDVGGFDEFPYMIPRLSKVTGERYGRGPGMLVLPDTKMLNEMAKTVLKSAQKIVDPPLQVPDSGFLMQIKTVPGAFNYYRANTSARIEPIETNGNIPIGIELINALRQQIIRGMYVDWMIMPSDPRDPAASGKGITATYVLQQRDEKMRMMAPMLARLQSEFLGPLIDRVFGILWRKSEAMGFGPGSPFPRPPQILEGVPLRVEYVSPIAIAQKSSQMDGVTRLLQLQSEIRQLDPQGILVIDPEAVMRIAQRDWNAPAGTLKSPERLQQETQSRAEAEQAMARVNQIESAAGAAKDGTAAIKNLRDPSNARAA